VRLLDLFPARDQQQQQQQQQRGGSGGFFHMAHPHYPSPPQPAEGFHDWSLSKLWAFAERAAFTQHRSKKTTLGSIDVNGAPLLRYLDLGAFLGSCPGFRCDGMHAGKAFPPVRTAVPPPLHRRHTASSLNSIFVNSSSFLSPYSPSLSSSVEPSVLGAGDLCPANPAYIDYPFARCEALLPFTCMLPWCSCA